MNGIQPEILENKIHPLVRLNAICPYFTMFPLTFPYQALRNARSTDTVYDPFCGRGTTNYAARLRGLSSYGVDSSPVAHAIAQAKLVNIRPSEVNSLCGRILKEASSSDIPKGQFWKKAYHPSTLRQICALRSYFSQRRRLSKAEIALRAVLLGILHGPRMKSMHSYLSNQMPRTFATKPEYSIKYWEQHGLKPPKVDLEALVQRKAGYMFDGQIPSPRQGRILLGDSRTIDRFSDKKFDWIITSPPYYGMANYEQDQWLRMWFLGGPEKIDYSRKGQLKHWSANAFAKDLSLVWKNTASKSRPGARLIIRFGALPSKSETSPSELVRESLKLADCGWKVSTVRKAGKPIDARRQANQFVGTSSGYIEEIDVFAILNV